MQYYRPTVFTFVYVLLFVDKLILVDHTVTKAFLIASVNLKNKLTSGRDNQPVTISFCFFLGVYYIRMREVVEEEV